MNSEQLSSVLTKSFHGTKSNFLGVFPSDHAPCVHDVSTKAPCAYILNTDPCTEPGTHWVAFYYPTSNSLEFFDSFGRSPSDYGFSIPNTLRVTHNTLSFQPLDSYLCGHYCIMYLHQRAYDISLSSIVNHLSGRSPRNSDHVVFDFVSNLVQK